jgi:alkanesulfonate monooxygenase SsuD/methylene tetrahydromethanopterin reductase-like flavin-dependent oxidoreductase (luciferase family)
VSPPLSYGIRLPNSGPFASPEALRAIATHAETLGFDTIWVHDHLAWPSHRRTHFAAGSVEAVTDQRPDFYESLSTLAYLAGMTRQVRLGVAGLVLPRRDPRTLAKQLATIDAMSGGRPIAGLAIGRFHHRRGRIHRRVPGLSPRDPGPGPGDNVQGRVDHHRGG